MIFLFLQCSILSVAQDVHFSMFNMSPLTLNPALTGVMDSDFRIANIYRTQWKTLGDPVNTFAASYDQQLYFLPNNISAGIILVSDKSGGIQLVENRVLLSTSIKHIDIKNTISAGIQFGLGTKTFSTRDVTYPEQYSREIGQFNPTLPNGETALELSSMYFDLNIGALYKRRTNRGPFTIGTSVFHVNSPDDSFFKNGDGLKPRFVVHMDYDFNVTKTWSIRPSLLVMTLSKAQEVVGTMQLGMNMQPNDLNIKRIWGGVAVRSGIERNSDAFAPMIGVDLKHFQVGASYDVTFSTLQLANDKRGAFEVSLIYNSLSSAASAVQIPCDRF